MGGLCFPSADSRYPTSHLAILGEEKDQDDNGRQVIRIIDEDYGMNVEALLAQAVQKMHTFKCRRFVMDEDCPEALRVRKWLKMRSRRNDDVPVILPAPITAFTELNALMQARTTGSKTFVFGYGSSAAMTYISVPDSDFTKNVSRYPQVGCVLLALGKLETTSARKKGGAGHVPAEAGY